MVLARRFFVISISIPTADATALNVLSVAFSHPRRRHEGPGQVVVCAIVLDSTV
jgi:hypothetical protein